MLWKTRNVEDTHGWRITTICCCIAGYVNHLILSSWYYIMYVY